MNKEQVQNLSKQDMFNMVWNHFIVEKNPQSVVIDDQGETNCRYRTPEGHKCAFGLFIPDELYTPAMEGRSAYAVISNNSELGKLFSINRELIRSMQRAHDAYSDLITEDKSKTTFHEVMESRMRKVAANFNLTIPGESSETSDTSETPTLP